MYTANKIIKFIFRCLFQVPNIFFSSLKYFLEKHPCIYHLRTTIMNRLSISLLLYDVIMYFLT